jgi:transposase InsO family protein
MTSVCSSSWVWSSALTYRGRDPFGRSRCALAETTVGSFKAEMINLHGPWRDAGQVEVAVFEWVDFFNTERPHEYLADLAPAEAEKLHYDHFTTTLQEAG